MCNTTSKNEEKESYLVFLKEILKIKGVWQILLMSIFLSFGAGTVGIAPAITSDNYARYYYGYTGPLCSLLDDSGAIPTACSLGAESAQTAASITSFVQHVFAFITGPILGSLSDRYGRRNYIFLGIFCFSLSPITLLIIQILPTINPVLYYVAYSCTGLASWFIPSYALLADVIPPHLRAPSFSLVLTSAAFSISIISEISVLYGFFIATIVSVFFCTFGFVFGVLFLPDTLTAEKKQMAINKMEEERTDGRYFLSKIVAPIKDLAILNRNGFFQLLGTIVVLSLFMKQGEQVILVFYFEGQLGFTQQDISIYLLFHSVTTVIANTVVLHAMIQRIGERHVIISAMILGVVYSILYGVTTSPYVVYFAVTLSSISGVSFSTYSSILSLNVEEHEQGAIQGVFASLQAVSYALGPLAMNYIFDKTVNGALLGPSTMFIFAGLSFALATVLSFMLSPEKSNSAKYKAKAEAEPLLIDNEF